MKINDKWKIEGAQGDYVLVETRSGTNPKTKKPTTTEHKTYHPSLDLCAKKIAKVSGIEAVDLKNVQAVIDRINNLHSDVLDMLKKHNN